MPTSVESDSTTCSSPPDLLPSGTQRAATAEPGNGDWEPLEEAIACYRARIPACVPYQGKHVLIHGVDGPSSTTPSNDACREGLRLWGRVAFLVKRVDLDEKPRPLVQVLLCMPRLQGKIDADGAIVSVLVAIVRRSRTIPPGDGSNGPGTAGDHGSDRSRGLADRPLLP